MNNNKRILSVKTLDKSDIFIRQNFIRFKFYLNIFLFKLNKISLLIRKFLEYIFNEIKSLKNLFILKVVDFLNLDNIKNIEKNKGSVSLFLKNISDDSVDK